MKTKLKTLRTAAGIALCVAWCGAASANTLTNGLLVHLSFDTNIAGVFSDDSGNAIDGTAVGNPLSVPGIVGPNAVSLTTLKDGSEFDYVTLGYPSQLQFDGSESFSIAFWTSYTNQMDDPPFISNKNWGSSGNAGWGIFTQNGGNFRVNVTGDPSASHQSTTATPVIRDGKWHHVAVTFDRTSAVTIYVDGTNVQASATDLTAVPGTIDTFDQNYNVNIGQDGTGFYTDGGGAQMIAVNLDDMGIWGRAISAGEISAIYQAGLKGSNILQVVTKLTPAATSISPAPGSQNVAGNATVSLNLLDADTAVVASTVKLSLDGAAVAAAVNKSTNLTTVVFAPTNLLAPNTTHTLSLSFADDNTPADQITTNWTFTVENYTVASANFAQTAASVLTNSPGFQMRVSQIDALAIMANDGTLIGTLPESVSYAEAQLAGLLIDPMTGLPQLETVTPGPLANGAYSITNYLNFSFSGADQGNFQTAAGYPNSTLPGITLLDDSNLAVEFVSYLYLPAGFYNFGVNSADGFRMTIGANPRDAFSAQVGILDERSTPLNTFFDLAVTQTGYYPCRIVWFRESKLADNNYNAGFQFFTITADGQKVLVNDLSNTNAVLAFQSSKAALAPYVQYAGPSSFVSPSHGRDFGLPSVQVLIQDGTSTTVTSNSINLMIDGSTVIPTLSQSNGTTTVTYTPGGLQLPRTTHTGQISYAAGGQTTTSTWQFNGLRNYVLPEPLFFENFDELSDGVLPTNWFEIHYTTVENNTNIFTDPNANPYLGWNVVNVSDVAAFGDGNRHFDVGLYQELNGSFFDPVTNALMVNQFLYAESDNRGGQQIQYVYTPAYNLSGKTGVVIAFNSAYEQNQNNIDFLEYTINKGTNWLPIAYLLQGASDSQQAPEIVRNKDGTINVAATMAFGISPVFTNSAGAHLGGHLGSYVGAPVTQALEPYIESRVNDDAHESKRIEIYRAPAADNQASVQFRFAQVGTGSWYWGLDNVGIYSVPSLVTTTAGLGLITARENGTNIVLSWTSASNVQLQQNSVLGTTNWVNVSGTLGVGGYTNAIANTNLFFRLIQH